MDNRLSVKILNWVSKIWSLLSILFVALFFLAHIFESKEPITLNFSIIRTFIFFPIGLLIGLVLAWKWNITGGIIAVLSIVGFHLDMFIQNGDPDFVILIELLAFPGLLFVILGILKKRSSN